MTSVKSTFAYLLAICEQHQAPAEVLRVLIEEHMLTTTEAGTSRYVLFDDNSIAVLMRAGDSHRVACYNRPVTFAKALKANDPDLSLMDPALREEMLEVLARVDELTALAELSDREDGGHA
jgi:hypothetical protein